MNVIFWPYLLNTRSGQVILIALLGIVASIAIRAETTAWWLRWIVAPGCAVAMVTLAVLVAIGS